MGLKGILVLRAKSVRKVWPESMGSMVLTVLRGSRVFLVQLARTVPQDRKGFKGLLGTRERKEPPGTLGRKVSRARKEYRAPRDLKACLDQLERKAMLAILAPKVLRGSRAYLG